MSAVELELDPLARKALQDAHDWRLIGLCLERPRAATRRHVSELAANSDDPLLRRAGENIASAEEGDYLALFGPGGVVSPRESGWRRTGDPARSIAAIRAFHAAFDYRGEHEDPIDHLAVLCGFAAWLCFKQAYAIAGDQKEAAEITREALERLVREHIAPCAEPFAARSAELGAEPWLAAAQALVARAGPRPKNVEGDWVPHGLGVEDCSLTCGLAGAGAEGTDASEEAELPPEFTAGLPPDQY